MSDRRLRPNVLVTGTPGTGKTTLSQAIASASGLRHVNVSELVKLDSLHSGWDAEFDSYVLDEDKVCDALEVQLSEGGSIVDFHSADFFPERWFDLVVVLRTETSVLWERLEKRGYPMKKVQENVQCEIMHILEEEVRESYRDNIIQVMASNTVEDMDHNMETVLSWLRAAGCTSS